MIRRLAPWGWLAMIAALLVALVPRVLEQGVLNVDLIHLLPVGDRSPAVESAVQQMREGYERRVVVLVGAEDQEMIGIAVGRVTDVLRTSPLLTRHFEEGDSVGEQAFSFYTQYRQGLVDDKMRTLLAEGQREAILGEVLRRYTSPGGYVSSAQVAQDPLLVFPAYLGGLVPVHQDNLLLKDGVLVFEADGRYFSPLIYELSDSPFSIAAQNAAKSVLSEAQKALSEAVPGAMLLSAGVVRHATRGTENARSEISTVGLGSLTGVVVLLLVVFRSARPFLISVGAIGFGILIGFAATLYVFDSVHLLTLVFGGSLVGISVDYAFHYFCERTRADEVVNADEALSRVRPGITLGLVTTLVGFIGMCVTPFPGLRQMAVFSAAGLVGSYLTVVLLFPALSRTMRPMARTPYDLSMRLVARIRGVRPVPFIAVFGVVCAIAVFGMVRLESQDDVRFFQSPDIGILNEQHQIERVLGASEASQFFLVEGETVEQLLTREEELRTRLSVLGHHGVQAVSQHVPSQERQLQNVSLLKSFLGTVEVRDYLEQSLGLKVGVLPRYLSTLDREINPVDFERWLNSNFSGEARHLYLGERDGMFRSAITLKRVYDLSALGKVGTEIEGVWFVDSVSTYSRLFTKYREQTIVFAAISYFLVIALLLWRYGLVGMINIMAAPMTATIVSLGALGLFGASLSLFNVVALLLVLGISVDYGIFFREAGEHNASTLLAVILSALTTILAFGLLAFSKTAAIQAFGVTVFIGISAALIISSVVGLRFGGTSQNGER